MKRFTYLSLLLAVVAAMLWAPVVSAQTADEINAALKKAYDKYLNLEEGANADYIPALAEVDPKIFGIVLVTVEGKVYTIGDITSEVSIQSISKVYNMMCVMQEKGPDAIYDNMGVDATGQVFNSIVAVEQYKGAEMNPLVNAGAIATVSMIKGGSADEVWGKIIGIHNVCAGRELVVLQDVYESEAATNQRNQAIAMLMYAYGRIESDPLQACDLYTMGCSIGVNTKDLGMMAATLANGGTNPVTGKVALDPKHVPEALAIMSTAGLYDDAGKWLYRTGLPAKSGVGGGIVAVAPGKFGVAAIAPPLDAAGNSIKAQNAIDDISRALGGNPYDVKPYSKK